MTRKAVEGCSATPLAAALSQGGVPCSVEAEQEERTAWEKVQEGWKKVGDQLSEWGVLSPRLMLAGGGLFMTLSNWGLLPAVGNSPLQVTPAVKTPLRKHHMR